MRLGLKSLMIKPLKYFRGVGMTRNASPRASIKKPRFWGIEHSKSTFFRRQYNHPQLPKFSLARISSVVGAGQSWRSPTCLVYMFLFVTPMVYLYTSTTSSSREKDSRASTLLPTQAMPEISNQLSEYSKETLETPKILGVEEKHQALIKMASLGRSYVRANKAKEAKFLLESAIPNLESIFGKNNEHTLGAKFDLAHAYRDLEEYLDAIPLLKSLFESRREQFAPDPAEILSSMLSIIRRDRVCPFSESCSLAIYLLEDHKDDLGDQRLKAVRDIIRFTDANARFYPDDAKLLYQYAVRNHREVFGKDEQLLKSILSLADIYVKNGELCEAESLLRSELALRKQDLGERHDRTLETMCSLGFICMRLGQVEEALQLLKAA